MGVPKLVVCNFYAETLFCDLSCSFVPLFCLLAFALFGTHLRFFVVSWGFLCLTAFGSFTNTIWSCWLQGFARLCRLKPSGMIKIYEDVIGQETRATGLPFVGQVEQGVSKQRATTLAWRPGCEYDNAVTPHTNTVLASDCCAQSSRVLARRGTSHLCDSMVAGPGVFTIICSRNRPCPLSLLNFEANQELQPKHRY